uniref:uncharacterized protein LOC122601963 isoform X2 n=1 Tax=Erigeron canadensis TaxID=72917 RepID=UPI001CB8D346|nr:uncharacterized protein LOC122601963 isoform X2 [Erigeron canadensis]
MAPITRRKRKEMTPDIEITTCDKSSKAALASSDEKKPKMRKTAQEKKIILCDNPRVDMAPLTSSRKSKTTKGCPIVPKRCLIIPKKESLPVDEEKFESLESKDSIFELIPSKTTRRKIDDADEEQVVTKDINVHIKALQKLITASFNFVRNYEFLIASAKEVLRLLDCFIKDTESPKFDWVSHRYVEGLRPQGTYTYPPDVSAYECNLAKGGRASVYPISPIFYEKSAPIDCIYYSSDGLCHCPCLNIEEYKIWREFEMLDEGNPESLVTKRKFCKEEEKRSIDLSYPLVGVIGGFAVAAFNKACETFKKVKHNLHDFEYMECNYVKGTQDYTFYMTIEAVEEGNLGVYEAIVVCSRDGGSDAAEDACLVPDVEGGCRTLLKFVLTYRTPAGMKAMALSLFSRLRSLCKTLKYVVGEKEHEIYLQQCCTTRMQRGIALWEMDLLHAFDLSVMKGIQQVLSLNLQLLFLPDCTRRSVPDDWSLPGMSCMLLRNSGKPCKGYDYDAYSRCLTSISRAAKIGRGGGFRKK